MVYQFEQATTTCIHVEAKYLEIQNRTQATSYYPEAAGYLLVAGPLCGRSDEFGSESYYWAAWPAQSLRSRRTSQSKESTHALADRYIGSKRRYRHWVFLNLVESLVSKGSNGLVALVTPYWSCKQDMTAEALR
jgi:hypothetical protein